MKCLEQPLSILFASWLGFRSASGRQRLGALQSLGHDVRTFHLDSYDTVKPFERGARLRVGLPAYKPDDVEHAGREFVKAVGTIQPDIAWVEKALMLRADHILEAKVASCHTQFICFQDDNPFGDRVAEKPLWTHFVEAIPTYDVHLVKREFDRATFAERGATRCELFMHGVYEPIFHPSSQAQSGRIPVSFVGAPMDHRIGVLKQLLGKESLPLHIYGAGWRRQALRWRYRSHFHEPVFAEDYASLLRSSDICLGFVSSSNRDDYTMRTFEIPGCAAFFLAERTETHQSLFDEGKEAEFFASADECADKCRFYMREVAARERIAEAGYRRCRRSEYSLRRRVADALRLVV